MLTLNLFPEVCRKDGLAPLGMTVSIVAITQDLFRKNDQPRFNRPVYQLYWLVDKILGWAKKTRRNEIGSVQPLEGKL